MRKRRTLLGPRQFLKESTPGNVLANLLSTDNDTLDKLFEIHPNNWLFCYNINKHNNVIVSTSFKK